MGHEASIPIIILPINSKFRIFPYYAWHLLFYFTLSALVPQQFVVRKGIHVVNKHVLHTVYVETIRVGSRFGRLGQMPLQKFTNCFDFPDIVSVDG